MVYKGPLWVMKYYVNVSHCPTQDFKLRNLESLDTVLNQEGRKLKGRN